MKTKSITPARHRYAPSFSEFPESSFPDVPHPIHSSLHNNENQDVGNVTGNFKRLGGVRGLREEEDKIGVFGDYELEDNIQEWVLGERMRSRTNLQGSMGSRARFEGELVRSQQIGVGEAQSYGRQRSERSEEKPAFVRNPLFKKANRLMTSTEDLLEEQRLRNDLIDDMIRSKNTKRCTQASITECANCEGKKAKYHLVANTRANSRFFCSKCAIKLLQQGYQVEEIKEWKSGVMERKKKEIQTLRERLCKLEASTTSNLNLLKSESDLQLFQRQRETIESVYAELAAALQRMRAKQILQLDESETKARQEHQQTHSRLTMQSDELSHMQLSLRESQINNLDMSEPQLQKMIEIITKDIADMTIQTFSEREYLPPPIDLRLQKLLNNLYSEVLVSQEETTQLSYNTSHDEYNPNFTDATIEEVKQPFRFLFPDDNDRQQTKQRLYLNCGDSR